MRARGAKGLFVFSLLFLAIAASAGAIFLLPGHERAPDSSFQRALWHFHRGEHAEALAILDTLPGLDARRLAARAAMEAGQPLRAATHLCTILEADPNDYDATLAIAKAYRTAGIDDVALLHYESATRLRPDDPVPWKEAGLLCLKRKDFALAQAYLQQAYALDPSNQELLDLMSAGLGEKDRETYGGLGLGRGVSYPRPQNPLEEIERSRRRR